MSDFRYNRTSCTNDYNDCDSIIFSGSPASDVNDIPSQLTKSVNTIIIIIIIIIIIYNNIINIIII